MPDDIFEIWSRYEQIAMHFNELLIQFRTHALGGVAGVGAFSGFLASKADTPSDRYRRLRFFVWCIVIAWVAIAILDLGYYSQLLKGAVDNLVQLEKHSKLIKFSTVLRRDQGWCEYVPLGYYGFVLLALVGTAWWLGRKSANDTPQQ